MKVGQVGVGIRGREGRPGSTIKSVEPDSVASVRVCERKVEASAEAAGETEIGVRSLLPVKNPELGACAEFEVE